jgi:hypothetical protein
LPTGLAVATYEGRLDRDPFADDHLVHTVCDGYHDTYHFMAGVVRRFEKSMLAMGAGLVRTAHPRHQHLDQRLAWPELRNRIPDHLDNVGGADKGSSTVKLACQGLLPSLSFAEGAEHTQR